MNFVKWAKIITVNIAKANEEWRQNFMKPELWNKIVILWNCKILWTAFSQMDRSLQTLFHFYNSTQSLVEYNTAAIKIQSAEKACSKHDKK